VVSVSSAPRSHSSAELFRVQKEMMGVTLVGWILILTPAAGPLDDAAKKELAALAGDWALVRFEQRGKVTDVPEEDRPVLTIKGTRLSMPALEMEADVIALDPSANPKLIDLRGPDRTTKGQTKDREGIYKVDGDTLTLVMYGKADKKRPTTFDTPTEAGINLYVLKRAKK
jgi:uncharacterized protein (TIGR03067 family)